jgi:hypothetical protein
MAQPIPHAGAGAGGPAPAAPAPPAAGPGDGPPLPAGARPVPALPDLVVTNVQELLYPAELGDVPAADVLTVLYNVGASQAPHVDRGDRKSRKAGPGAGGGGGAPAAAAAAAGGQEEEEVVEGMH